MEVSKETYVARPVINQRRQLPLLNPTGFPHRRQIRQSDVLPPTPPHRLALVRVKEPTEDGGGTAHGENVGGGEVVHDQDEDVERG
jgi:hypothetical protein